MRASCARQKRGAWVELPAQTLHEVCHQALGTGRRALPPAPQGSMTLPLGQSWELAVRQVPIPLFRPVRSGVEAPTPCCPICFLVGGGPSCSPHLEPSFLRQEEGQGGGALDQLPALGGHLEATLPHVSESLPDGPICQSPVSSRPELGCLAAAHSAPQLKREAPYPGNPSQKEARTAGLGQPLWFPWNARLGMRLLPGLGWGNKGNPSYCQ